MQKKNVKKSKHPQTAYDIRGKKLILSQKTQKNRIGKLAYRYSVDYGNLKKNSVFRGKKLFKSIAATVRARKRIALLGAKNRHKLIKKKKLKINGKQKNI